jgi:hypothetical protein
MPVLGINELAVAAAAIHEVGRYRVPV